SFFSLSGYIQTSSGSASDNTNSWDPVTRDTSAISWVGGGVAHSALYAIGPNDNVEISVDGGSFTNLGGYAKQISAGLDASGLRGVYAIGSNNAVSVNAAAHAGWVGLGGYAKQISATVANTFYSIGLDNAVYVNNGSGFVSLGGYAKQISAG